MCEYVRCSACGGGCTSRCGCGAGFSYSCAVAALTGDHPLINDKRRAQAGWAEPDSTRLWSGTCLRCPADPSAAGLLDRGFTSVDTGRRCVLWDLCPSGLPKVQCSCGHCLEGVRAGCVGAQVGLILQCARDRMRYSDAWSDACVQCRATPAEHWDELAARQLDPAELESMHLVRDAVLTSARRTCAPHAA